MELVIERLKAGQIVSCTDNQGHITEGEVVTFDVPFRLVIISKRYFEA